MDSYVEFKVKILGRELCMSIITKKKGISIILRLKLWEIIYFPRVVCMKIDKN